MNRVLIVVLLVASFVAKSENISVGLTEWGGYTNSDGTGIYLDIINSVFGKQNIDLKFSSYQRTLHKFREGEYDFIIGVYREEIKSAIFPRWHLDMEHSVLAFYNKNKLNINHVAELNKLTVGWMRGYGFERYLPLSNKPYLVNSQRDGFKLLKNNRIDAFIDYFYNQPQTTQLSSIEILPKRKLYLAFANTDKGKKLAQLFDEQMNKLNGSGELKTIFGDAYDFSQFGNFTPSKTQIILRSRDNHLLSEKQIEAFSSLENKILNMVLPELSNFDLEVATYSSLNEDVSEFKHATNTCIVNKVKTPERLEHFAFSLPFTMYTGLRLYSLKQLDVEPHEPMHLAEFLRHNLQLKLGVAPGQYYPDKLQKQINAIDANQIVNQAPNIVTQLNELLNDKYQLKLEYPSLVRNNWSHLTDKAIFSYPVSGQKDFTLGHLMCGKSPATEKFIAAFNQKLFETYQKPKFKQWLKADAEGVSEADFELYFSSAFQPK